MIARKPFLIRPAAVTQALAMACALLALHLSLASGWSQTPIISEFMAENDNTLDDENGDSPDWIEIYNPTVVSWNLDGWFLTDDARNPTKWRFPAVTLNPNDFLVVFASGKNRTNTNGRLHTNFGLSDIGEYLALIQPDGTSVATQFAPTYPAQIRDVSFGSLMVENEVQPGPPTRLSPTPGRPNPAQDYGSSPPPVQFSRPGGTFVQPFSLMLWMGRPVPTTTIHYELVTNGQLEFTATNIPTTSSPIYSNSLWIDRPVQVRARAFSSIPGTSPSVIKTETYLPIATNLATFQSTLPLVVIHTIGPNFIPTGSSAASVSVAFFDTESGFASLANRPSLIRRAGINVRGSDTLGLPKESYALELWDELNQDDKAPVLGLPEESDWVLYGPYYYDRSYLQNTFVYELSRNLGRYAPRTRFVELFLNSSSNAVTFPDPTHPVPTNAGSYRGVYVLQEKVKRAGSRVNIDRLAPAQITEPDLTGGYLLKIDRFDPGDLVFMTARSTIIFEDPEGQSTPTAQLDYIRRYFSLFDTSTISPGYTNFTGTNHYSHYVDLDAAIDHQLLNVLCLNVEAFRLNSFLYKPRNGQITMGPVWDFDRALGSTDARTFNPLTWRSTVSDFGTDFFNIPIPPNWASLFGDTDFFQRWIDRYQELRAGQWATNQLTSLIDSLANQVRAAQPRDAARWGTAASPRTGTITSGGYSHTFPGSYQGEIDFLKRWLLDRVGFMDTQFLARPILLTEPVTSNGNTLSRVSAVHPAGLSGTEVYYTLDGTDPRASQNLTNGSAQRYTGSFVVDTSVRVAARAINKTEFRGNLNGPNNPPLKSFWSGLSRLSVTGLPPALRITEIMYHPAPVPPGSAHAKEDFQFIELKNTGTTPIRMGGIHFTSGIEFTFPSTILNSGAYALLVKNRTAFEQRHGTGHPVAGEFTGTLALGGERLTLVDLIGHTILDFEYSDLWYPLTDGPGLSLAANIETTAPNVFTVRGGWRASRLIHGSPGGPEPDTIPFVSVVINELLSNSQSPYEDAVELHNPTDTEADISHWYLTDEFNQPRKFQFPPGTIISPHGFQAFDEHSFNPFSDPPPPTSFSFNANGESVFLFSANEAGDLTGYVHGFRFGASGTNVTFGRYLDDDGQEMFLAQSEISFGQSNSVPRAVPVGQRPTLALTEIMHDPVPAPLTITNAPGELEFVEIKNIGADLIDLTAAQFVSGIAFTFPSVELAPGGYALIVKNRPAFAARYGTNLPVVGEYSGGLASEGEQLVLISSTGEPVLDFTYDTGPFPLTKGIGFSLVLRDEQSPLSSYSSPAMWRTGSIEGGTPGYAEPSESWQPILINEVEATHVSPPNTASHRIELFNPTTSPVDVGGWFFTHDFTGPLRVPIPAPTVIPPGGFFVINNVSLPSLRDTGSGLFSRVGLVSADPNDGRRTGYLVELEAGPGLAGTSFGPHRISTGEQHVVPLASQTFGASNTGPRVGPIVFSEIHYHPVEEFVGSVNLDNTRDEYIELSNLSPNTVLLFDPANPSDTWRLGGDISYQFPPGTTIPPGGLVLLVSFNPADVAASNRFNATFFPPPSTKLHGPWTGSLKNSSGSIELTGDALNSHTVRMDHLHYSDRYPWPSAADGNGASLGRVSTFAYGDDPANWRAMSPSAGRPTNGGNSPVILTHPQDTLGIADGAAGFEVVATGTTTLSYQWFHNRRTIPGATSNVLQLQNLRLEDAGVYHVVVFDNGGVSTSDDADLIVRIGPGFTRQPTNIFVRIPPDPAAAPATNVQFQVTVTTANPPLLYQWHFNGVNIPGATNDSLLITNVSLVHEGLYACVAADRIGTLVSAPARLTPLIKPQIIVPPLSQRVITGTTFFVSATFLGHPLPFGIEWRKGSDTLTSNSVPRPWDFGAFTAPTNLVTNQMYRLVVKNEAYPSPGVAATFHITTLLDSDADGLPDEFETAHGLNSADAVDATLDSDGDLMSNSAEYIAGTDPLDPLSYLSIEPPANVDTLTGVTIRFLAVSNRTYSVEARSDDESSPWITIAGAVAFPTNRMVSIIDPLPAGTNTHRTYRLVTPHQTNP